MTVFLQFVSQLIPCCIQWCSYAQTHQCREQYNVHFISHFDFGANSMDTLYIQNVNWYNLGKSWHWVKIFMHQLSPSCALWDQSAIRDKQGDL